MSARLSNRPSILLAAATLLALGAACRGPSSEALPATAAEPERADLGDLARCFLAEGVYLCSLPDADAFELAQRRGVELVIDLRADAEPLSGDQVAARVVRDLGLVYEHEPIQADLMDDEHVDHVLDLLAEPREGQVMMFCENGSKAAMLFAIHRAVDRFVPVRVVLEDARQSGMKPGASEEQVRRQISRRLAART